MSEADHNYSYDWVVEKPQTAGMSFDWGPSHCMGHIPHGLDHYRRVIGNGRHTPHSHFYLIWQRRWGIVKKIEKILDWSLAPLTEICLKPWNTLAMAEWLTQKMVDRLGKSGLKVSKIILGCMSYGSSQWEGSPWVLDEAEALPLLKKAYDVGINTWDTANTYSNGRSETIIGKALKEYSIPRERVVILTKVYYPVLEGSEARPNPAINNGQLTNQMGLSRKHILMLLDRDVEPEEIMKALHDLVQMGKVRYIGASSMYCWEFARLQYTAQRNNWTAFISMQPFYNLLYREEEREMIPFCNATGVGVIPWSPLARGLLTRPLGEQSERSAQDKKTEKWCLDANLEIISKVEEVAKRKGVSMADLATAWVLSKGCCPIVGLGSLKRIESAASSLSVNISNEEARELEDLYRPMNVVGM